MQIECKLPQGRKKSAIVACIYKALGKILIRNYIEGPFCCILPGGYNFSETLKPLKESKVLKCVHKGQKSTLQTSKKTQKKDGLTLVEE